MAPRQIATTPSAIQRGFRRLRICGGAGIGGAVVGALRDSASATCPSTAIAGLSLSCGGNLAAAFPGLPCSAADPAGTEFSATNTGVKVCGITRVLMLSSSDTAVAAFPLIGNDVAEFRTVRGSPDSLEPAPDAAVGQPAGWSGGIADHRRVGRQRPDRPAHRNRTVVADSPNRAAASALVSPSR